MEFKEKNLGYTIAILSIFTAFVMISEWKKYETKVITASKKPITDSLKYDTTVSTETPDEVEVVISGTAGAGGVLSLKFFGISSDSPTA